MSVEEILLDAEERMEKALAKLKHDLAGIRTGRANPGLVDSLRVEVYGSPTPIKQLASVSAPEPHADRHSPVRSGHVKDIEKAIIASDLGLDSAERRQGDPPQHPAAVDRSAPQDGRPASRNWPKRPRSRSATSAATATKQPTRKKRTRR